MHSDVNRRQYLSSMGIVSWSARALPYLIFQAKNILLVTQLQGELCDQQQQLWQKMIAALHASDGKMIVPTQFNFNALLTSAEHIIILGDLVAKTLPQIKQKPVVTHGLHAMIRQPALKADVWHVLKYSFLN